MSVSKNLWGVNPRPKPSDLLFRASHFQKWHEMEKWVVPEPVHTPAFYADYVRNCWRYTAQKQEAE